MAKRKYVIDTSVFLTDHRSIVKFGDHDIIIPLKVLEEIDKHKKRQDVVGSGVLLVKLVLLPIPALDKQWFFGMVKSLTARISASVILSW